MLSNEFLEKMTAKLEEEKELAEVKIVELERPEEPMDNPDEDDLGHDAAEDFLEESLVSVHKNIIMRIDDALLRIKDGTYGRCIECGAEIPETDLEKEPWAEHCAGCGLTRT